MKTRLIDVLHRAVRQCCLIGSFLGAGSGLDLAAQTPEQTDAPAESGALADAVLSQLVDGGALPAGITAEDGGRVVRNIAPRESRLDRISEDEFRSARVSRPRRNG